MSRTCACAPCFFSKVKCDFQRPCHRCKKRGTIELCRDPRPEDERSDQFVKHRNKDIPPICAQCKVSKTACDRGWPCSRCVRIGKGKYCRREEIMLLTPRFRSNMLLETPLMFQNPKFMFNTAVNRVLDIFPGQISEFFLQSSFERLRLITFILSGYMLYDNAVAILKVLSQSCMNELLDERNMEKIESRISLFYQRSCVLYSVTQQIFKVHEGSLMDSDDVCSVIYQTTFINGDLFTSLRLNEAAERFLGYSTEEFVEICVLRDQQVPEIIPEGFVKLPAAFLYVQIFVLYNPYMFF
jgi:hypothetical protein